MNDKKNKIGIVLMLSGILLVFIGFFLIINNSSKNNESKSLSIYKIDDGEIDINNEVIQEYFNMYKYSYIDDNVLLDSLKDSTINKHILSTRLIKTEDLEVIKCYAIDENLVEEENSSCGGTSPKSVWIKGKNTTNYVKKSILNNYYKYYFGENENISLDSFNYKSLSEKNMLIYDDRTQSYIEIGYGTGKTGSFMIETIEKAEKKGNDLIITSNLFPEDNSAKNNTKITLVLTWEDSTNHYILKIEK